MVEQLTFDPGVEGSIPVATGENDGGNKSFELLDRHCHKIYDRKVIVKNINVHLQSGLVIIIILTREY